MEAVESQQINEVLNEPEDVVVEILSPTSSFARPPSPTPSVEASIRRGDVSLAGVMMTQCVPTRKEMESGQYVSVEWRLINGQYITLNVHAPLHLLIRSLSNDCTVGLAEAVYTARAEILGQCRGCEINCSE